MKVENISKQLDKKMIIKDISFQIKKGEIVGLVGRNGEGKTTLFRTMANHYQKDMGNIFINEQNIDRFLDHYADIFYLDTQFNFLSNVTPLKIGQYYEKIYPKFDKKKYQELLVKHQLPMKKTFKSYSKGMQGLLRIILAVCSNATYLFLDEPFDGLDILVKKQVIRLVLSEVTEKKKAALISSHNLPELEYLVDRALIMKQGEIIKDYSLESIRDKVKKIQMMFQNNEIPQFVREACTIIEVRGKVTIALFDQLTPMMMQQIENLNPILFEELPLSLEDLFASNLIDEFDFEIEE